LTNEITPQATTTGHKLLREVSRRNLEIYTEKRVNQMNKRTVEYQISNLVRVAIPKIDRFSTVLPTVPCRIIKKIEDKYQIGSKFGIIEVCYSAGELEPLGTAIFPELIYLLVKYQ